MTYLARALVLPIRVYQRFVSPVFGQRCRFRPSCSEYAAQALLEHGFVRGGYLGLRRLLRCHPWNAGGDDPVPGVFTWRALSSPRAGDPATRHGEAA